MYQICAVLCCEIVRNGSVTSCYFVCWANLIISGFSALSFKVPVTERVVHELRERVYLSQRPSFVPQDPPKYIDALKENVNPFFPTSRTWNSGKQAELFIPYSGVKLAQFKQQDKV